MVKAAQDPAKQLGEWSENGRRNLLEAYSFQQAAREHKVNASWQSCGGDSDVANPAVATINACSQSNSVLSSHAETKGYPEGTLSA
jgi:hypothetical protein